MDPWLLTSDSHLLDRAYIGVENGDRITMVVWLHSIQLSTP